MIKEPCGDAAGVRIRAAYAKEAGAREAAMKLHLLRAQEISEDHNGRLSATVNADVVERAFYLIQQTGGVLEPDTV
ncbi:conserved hypothetical protein [Paenibacillus curdlanolyticus YK9]|uniref:Uncharacterized protein n=1 Tax=Paenibacillus curdlanolyticus YK9 TaxID=717606 RepID=E0I372_9BACL|nr:hypothetical protein [Paenibacillus curdlanolyticus]EFM12736.1 conserved hypothetical protein [Paenibacillus curdlanolyticus YK9]